MVWKETREWMNWTVLTRILEKFRKEKDSIPIVVIVLCPIQQRLILIDFAAGIIKRFNAVF